MEERGILSSWLTMARNSARSRSSSSRGVRSWRVTTKDSTSPASERMGVAFTSAVTLRPSGFCMTISSARTLSPKLNARAMGNARSGTPPSRRPAGWSSPPAVAPGTGPGFSGPPRSGPASRLKDTGVSRPGVQDHDAHRRGVDQGLQVGPGPLLVPVAAGVGDDHRRLGGEHDQGLLIFLAELSPALPLGHVEVADALAPVEDRRGQEGHHGTHRHGRAELRKGPAT